VSAAGNAKDSPSLLSSARDFAFVLAIFAFFTGFEYRFFYFRYLGIPTSTLSIADTQTLADSFSVFLSHRWYVLGAFALVVLTTFTLRAMKPQQEKLAPFLRLLLLLFVLLSFPVLNEWAQETAATVYWQLVGGQSAPEMPIKFSLTNKFPTRPLVGTIVSAMQKGCVQLVTRSSDTLYLLVRQTNPPTVFVAAMPTEYVASWITYRSETNGKRCTP
jgi:hypothetical protein